MANQESPKRDDNVIDFTQHKRRKGEIRNAMPSFRESYYAHSRLRPNEKADAKKKPSMKLKVLYGLQFVIVLFGIVLVFRGCFH